MALIKCPNCGKEISDKAVSCVNCGFTTRNDNIVDLEGDFNSNNKKTRWKIIIVIITILIIMTAIIVVKIVSNNKVDEVSQSVMNDIDSIGEVTLDDAELIEKTISRYSTLTEKQKNQVKNYSVLLDAEDQLRQLQQNEENQIRENFNNAVIDMYLCAIDCEQIIGNLRELWDDDITHVESVFVNDATWNDNMYQALVKSYLKSDLIISTREDIADLQEANKVVVEDNKDLINWPDNMSEEKELYDELYGYYLNLYDSATNPSGNYISYCSNTNDYIE